MGRIAPRPSDDSGTGTCSSEPGRRPVSRASGARHARESTTGLLSRRRPSILGLVANTALDGVSGCWAKVERADELTHALESEIDRAMGGRDYIGWKIGGESSFQLLAHVSEQPPWERWGVIVGEVAHDLRSALDQITWALTVANRGSPPEPPTGWWKRVEFPIFTDPARFQASAKDDLRGVHSSVLPLFESLQPYRRSPSHPERDPLAILHNLSIRDKHQALPLAAVVGRGGAIKASVGSLRAQSRARSVPAPIADGAVVAMVRTISGKTAEPTPKIGDTVRGTFDVHIDTAIGFATGPPAFGGELIPKLVALRKVTYRCLRRLTDPRLF